MAPKKKEHKEDHGAFQQTLHNLGLTGDWSWIIHQAVVNQWSQAEFETSLVNSKPFRRQFPGLVDANGQISEGLRALGSMSLRSAITTYGRLTAQYSEVADNFGKMSLGRQVFGKAIANGISPDELGQRLQVIEQAKTSSEYRSFFNQALDSAGLPQLDELGWRKFMAGASDRKFYDVYEAATLNQRLGLGQKASWQVARQIGGIGQPADLEHIVQQVNQILPDIGHELDAMGISKADLAVVASGSDPKNLGPTLAQLVANRRAKSNPLPGYQPHGGLGGGVATQPSEGSAAYG